MIQTHHDQLRSQRALSLQSRHCVTNGLKTAWLEPTRAWHLPFSKDAIIQQEKQGEHSKLRPDLHVSCPSGAHGHALHSVTSAPDPVCFEDITLGL